MTPPRSEGFVRMPDAEFEAILTRAAEEGAKRALAEWRGLGVAKGTAILSLNGLVRTSLPPPPDLLRQPGPPWRLDPSGTTVDTVPLDWGRTVAFLQTLASNRLMTRTPKLVLPRRAWLLLALIATLSPATAQQIEPLIETFDGGWRSGDRAVACDYRGQSYQLEVENDDARLLVDNEYQPPLHIRLSPGGLLYIYGDGESGIHGVALVFVNNEMVARDFEPGESQSNPYSNRIRCNEIE